MSHRIYIAAIAIALSAGCAKKMEPGQIEPSSLQAPAAEKEEATAPEAAPSAAAEGGSAADSLVACSTPECEAACADAGALLGKCVAAFDAGCFSDTLPDDKSVCSYAEADEAVAKPKKKLRAAEPARSAKSIKPQAAEEKAAESDDTDEEEKGVRMKVIMD